MKRVLIAMVAACTICACSKHKEFSPVEFSEGSSLTFYLNGECMIDFGATASQAGSSQALYWLTTDDGAAYVTVNILDGTQLALGRSFHGDVAYTNSGFAAQQVLSDIELTVQQEFTSSYALWNKTLGISILIRK